MKPLAQFSDFVPDFIYAFCFAGGAESYVPALQTGAQSWKCPLSVFAIRRWDSSAEAVLTRLEALEAAVRRGIPAAPSSLPEPAESGEKAAKHLPQKKKEAPSPLEQAAAEEKASAPILADLSDAHPFGEWQEVLGRLLKTNPPLFAALKNSDAYEKRGFDADRCKK